MPGPRAKCLIVCPYEMLILRNVKIQAQQNYLPQPLAHAKVLRHTSFTSSESKKRKNCPGLVPRYATIARHLNVVKIILHGTFDEKKVKYVSDAEALLKRTWCILNRIVLPWRRSVLTAPNNVHSDKFSVLFRSFLQQLKAKNLFMIALLQTLQ